MAEFGFREPFSQNCFYKLLILIRRLMTILEIFSPDFEETILPKISSIAFWFFWNMS